MVSKYEHQLHEGLNIGFHVWILFTFLTIFFFKFITRRERETITHELNSEIKNQVKVILDNVVSGYEYIGEEPDWDAINQIATNIEKKYNGKDPEIDIHNQKLLNLAIGISVGIFALLIGFILYFGVYKEYNLKLKDVLIDNVVIAIFVGIIELLFFLKVALNFSPITKSEMITDIIDRTQHNINIHLN